VRRLRQLPKKTWPIEREKLALFGVAICRSLKSNAVTSVREWSGRAGAYQLVGAGQGQPNRVEALKWLAIPRAQSVLTATGGVIEDCIWISDAFFPFRDTVDEAYKQVFVGSYNPVEASQTLRRFTPVMSKVSQWFLRANASSDIKILSSLE